MRKWKPSCLCWLCKTYLQVVDFLLKDAEYLLKYFNFCICVSHDSYMSHDA